jgi:hypothetical protein
MSGKVIPLFSASIYFCHPKLELFNMVGIVTTTAGKE